MTVLITGASGGIGYAVTEYFAKNGIGVYALDVRKREFSSDNIQFFPLDISKPEEIEKAAARFCEAGIKFDAIINIAGIFTIDSFIEVPPETLQKLFDVNFFGTVFVNKYFYPLLKENGRIIVTTSEVAPLDPMPFNAIYNASKTALESYTQGLRQELNLLGQKVITVRPGAFNTNLAQGSLEKTKELTDKTVLYKAQSKKFYALVKSFMGKPLPPEKIAPTYYRALTAKHPKLIYKKHLNPLLLLMNILPKRLQCFAVKTIIK
ncbi:MAG: SDR family NAD(P)-dependent oxidoreductase [Clostridia bacterium]|nr:SDR family NAD(P)-dependent oxidoreductase [Clostridia bacterium]